MVKYKDRMEKLEIFVLQYDNEVIGTFGNLKKVCDYMEDEDFPSYWTLVRKKEYPITYKDFKIYKVKHH